MSDNLEEMEESSEKTERDKRIYACNTWRDRKNRRLNIYYDELDLLLKLEKQAMAGVQSYSINGKSISRYEANLDSIRKQIDDKLTQIEKLEGILQGNGCKKMLGVIPIDS